MSVISGRRDVLKVSLGLAGLAGMAIGAGAAKAAPPKLGASPLVQPPLPFAETALEPIISARTFSFHYGKHQKAYFDNLNKLVAGTPAASESLEGIILATAGDKEKTAVFNNAAQAWNHNFYWKSLSIGPQAPTGRLAQAIDRDFGSFDALKKKLAAVAVGQFGAGWGWLVLNEGKLDVMATSNADLPFVHNKAPLLTIDVWEHAYYLDYQNRRADYVAALVDKTLNWDFATQNYEANA